MIDFACKKFELNEVIKCGLMLTKSDFNIMLFLIKNKNNNYKSIDLAKQLKLNLSTCQRSLKKLYEKNIIIRSQVNFISGGYVFRYKISNKKHIRNMVMNVINSWVKKVEESLEKW